MPMGRAVAQPGDGFTHARGVPARRGGTAKQAPRTATGVLDQPPMHLCHGNLDARGQRELIARWIERTRLGEEAFGVQPARGRGLSGARVFSITEKRCRQNSDALASA